MEVKNAIIESTHLGKEDHGIPTCYLNLRYEGSGQSFGGYNLTTKFIMKCIETLGVTNWEALPGTMLRVRADMSKIEAIGHIMDDKWFCPKTDLYSEGEV
jgi:hypothetical protein